MVLYLYPPSEILFADRGLFMNNWGRKPCELPGLRMESEFASKRKPFRVPSVPHEGECSLT